MPGCLETSGRREGVHPRRWGRSRLEDPGVSPSLQGGPWKSPGAKPLESNRWPPRAGPGWPKEAFPPGTWDSAKRAQGKRPRGAASGPSAASCGEGLSLGRPRGRREAGVQGKVSASSRARSWAPRGRKRSGKLRRKSVGGRREEGSTVVFSLKNARGPFLTRPSAPEQRAGLPWCLGLRDVAGCLLSPGVESWWEAPGAVSPRPRGLPPEGNPWGRGPHALDALGSWPGPRRRPNRGGWGGGAARGPPTGSWDGSGNSSTCVRGLCRPRRRRPAPLSQDRDFFARMHWILRRLTRATTRGRL